MITKELLVDEENAKIFTGRDYNAARMFLLLMKDYPSDNFKCFDWTDFEVAFEQFHKMFRQSDVFDDADKDMLMWHLISLSNVPCRMMKSVKYWKEVGEEDGQPSTKKDSARTARP